MYLIAARQLAARIERCRHSYPVVLAVLVAQSIQVVLAALEDHCRQEILERQSIQGIQVVQEIQHHQVCLHTKPADNS